MVHTRDLQYFLAVAEHLHITRAAASLFISQPALSKQIASLERTYGAVLFDRRPDGVALTRAGEALVAFARQIVDLDRDAAAAVHLAARTPAKLTVGFWLSPAGGVLEPAVSAFGARFPDTRLRLRRAGWGEPCAGVLDGQADVGLVEAAEDEPVRGVRSHRLSVEDLVLAVGVGHPLAGRQTVTAADLAGETVFVLPREAGQLSGLRLTPAGGASLIEYVTTIDETLDGIGLGLGVCVVTPIVLAAHPHPKVRAVPMLGVGRAAYHLVWRTDDEDRPELRYLVKELAAAFSRWTAETGTEVENPPSDNRW